MEPWEEIKKRKPILYLSREECLVQLFNLCPELSEILMEEIKERVNRDYWGNWDPAYIRRWDEHPVAERVDCILKRFDFFRK